MNQKTAMEMDSPHTEKTKNNHTSWLWFVIVALIIIGSVIAYLANKNKPASSHSPSKKPFTAAVNSNVPMVITINTRAQGDPTGSIAILQSDGKGNYNH